MALPVALLLVMASDRSWAQGRSSNQAWSFYSEKYDSDSDGKVTPAEYDRDKDTFARLDRDGDGTLSAADWSKPSKGGIGRKRGSDRSERVVPQVGDIAPDFDLSYVKNSKRTARLSSFAGKKPVALIFGSYT